MCPSPTQSKLLKQIVLLQTAMTARVEESRNQVDCLHWYPRSERISHIMIKWNHKTHWWGKILTTTPFLFDYWHRQRSLSSDQTWRVYTIYVYIHILWSIACLIIYISYIYIYIIYFSFVSICILYERYLDMDSLCKVGHFCTAQEPQTKIQR